MKTCATLVLGILIGMAAAPAAQPAPATATARSVWYFYRVKWGHQDEFLDLFQKNHYPLLKAQVGSRIAAVKAYVPTFHGDGRADWTFATELRFTTATAPMLPSPEADLARKLFPDQGVFRKEEARRFEILDAHWDVPLNEVDFETRKPTR